MTDRARSQHSVDRPAIRKALRECGLDLYDWEEEYLDEVITVVLRGIGKAEPCKHERLSPSQAPGAFCLNCGELRQIPYRNNGTYESIPGLPPQEAYLGDVRSHGSAEHATSSDGDPITVVHRQQNQSLTTNAPADGPERDLVPVAFASGTETEKRLFLAEACITAVARRLGLDDNASRDDIEDAVDRLKSVVTSDSDVPDDEPSSFIDATRCVRSALLDFDYVKKPLEVAQVVVKALWAAGFDVTSVGSAPTDESGVQE